MHNFAHDPNVKQICEVLFGDLLLKMMKRIYLAAYRRAQVRKRLLYWGLYTPNDHNHLYRAKRRMQEWMKPKSHLVTNLYQNLLQPKSRHNQSMLSQHIHSRFCELLMSYGTQIEEIFLRLRFLMILRKLSLESSLMSCRECCSSFSMTCFVFDICS